MIYLLVIYILSVHCYHPLTTSFQTLTEFLIYYSKFQLGVSLYDIILNKHVLWWWWNNYI